MVFWQIHKYTTTIDSYNIFTISLFSAERLDRHLHLNLDTRISTIMKETKFNVYLLITVLIIITWGVSVVNSGISITSSTEVLLSGTTTLILTWTYEKIHSVKIEHTDINTYYAVCGINPITHSCTSCDNGGSSNNHLQSKCSPKRIEWVLNPPRLENAGKYLLTLSVLYDNEIQKNSYIVHVHEKPSKVSLNCYYKICNSNKLSCECLANPGNPKGIFRWTLTKNNEVPTDLTHLSSTSQKYNERIHSTLSYDVNKVDHESKLLCEAINKYAIVKSSDYVIKYRDKPIISSNFETHLDLHESSRTTINCKASGHPKPTIKWKLPDGRELSKSDLQMSDLLKHRPGNYSCIAQNCMGNDTRQTEITVQYAPQCSSVSDKIINITENLYATSLKLVCKVSSSLQTKIQWTTLPVWSKDWLNFFPLKAFTIDEYQEGNYKFSSLTINCISIRDLGTYKCQATNSLGSCSETIQIRKAEDKEYNTLKAENERNRNAMIGLSVITGILAIILSLITAYYVKFKKNKQENIARRALRTPQFNLSTIESQQRSQIRRNSSDNVLEITIPRRQNISTSIYTSNENWRQRNSAVENVAELNRPRQQSDSNLSCGICLSTYTRPVSLIPCGHVFCQQCLDEHLATLYNEYLPQTCPKCRSHIIDSNYVYL